MSNPVSKFIQTMLGVSSDEKLILEHVIDSEGRLKLYHPCTQEALLKTDDFRNHLVAAIKAQVEEEVENECEKRKTRKSRLSS